jgi:hypothetical protein
MENEITIKEDNLSTPSQVVLSDGRIVTKYNPRVRELANAEGQARGKEHLVKYAVMSAKIRINGKPVVMEDILDLYEDDLIKIGDLFEDDEEEKNS